ncbi:MAG: hypothetical protein L0Z50_09795 [Verrucomicrobiales bacterium]|nr:hypothetical protein [Verrucomicrobiales bacterium]
MNKTFRMNPTNPFSKAAYAYPESVRSTAQPVVHDTKITVNVVVAYADLETRALAMQVNEGLIQQLHREFDFRSAWWSFQVLQEPEIMESAAQAAVEADLIFCSINGSGKLPSAAQAWIDLWLPRRNGGDSALIALLKIADADVLRPLPIELYLRDVAQAAKMAFFIKEFDLAVGRHSFASETFEERKAGPQCFPPFSAGQELGTARWGINE